MTIYNESKVSELMKTQEGKLELAMNGVNLHKLIKNKDWRVREEVAKHNFRLDHFVNDRDWRVRQTVARLGFGLEILVNDKIWSVRREVAKKGFGLEILVNDEDSSIRREVADQGFGLDQLVEDSVPQTREVAYKLKEATHIEVVERDFGTYNGNLYLYIFGDKFEILSNCFSTNSLELWEKKCSKRLDSEISKETAMKIKKILEENGCSEPVEKVETVGF